MTVSSTSSRVVYAGNGSTVVFPFAFRVNQPADLVVVYSDATGTDVVLSPSQYAASGFGQEAGGSVTYPLSGGPIATGTRLTIYRNVATTQPTSLSNQGALWPQVIEAALDRIVMIAQGFLDTASRTLRVGPTDTVTLNPLPKASQRANAVLGFDGAGQPYAATLTGSLVAVSNGFTSVFTTPIQDEVMGVDFLKENNTVETVANSGGLWPLGRARAYVALSRSFSAADLTGSNSPYTTLFAKAVENGSGADVQACLVDAVAYSNNASIFAMNILSRVAENTTGGQIRGLEIDVAAGSGATTTGGFGLGLNAFTISRVVAAGIQFGGINGGTFGDGIMFGGIESTGTALGMLAGQGAMSSFINTSQGIFNTAAIVLANTHRIRFSGTSSTHGFMYMDGSNNLLIVNGSGSTVFVASDGSTTNASLDNSGNFNTIGSYRVSGTKVLGARDIGWTAMTGTSDRGTAFDAATVTLTQLASRVKAIQVALTTHGLIGA
jgi:hypothetical protein